MPTTGPMSSDQKREIAERKQKNALGLAQDSHTGPTVAAYFQIKAEKPRRIWRAPKGAPERDEFSEFTARTARSELQSNEMGKDDADEINAANKAKVLEHASAMANIAYDAYVAAGPNTNVVKVTGLLGSDGRVEDARNGDFRYNLNGDQDIAAGSRDRASVVNLAVALVSGLYDQQYAVGFKESVQIGVWLHFACNYNPTGKVKGARVVFDRAGLDQARTDFLF